MFLLIPNGESKYRKKKLSLDDFRAAKRHEMQIIRLNDGKEYSYGKWEDIEILDAT